VREARLSEPAARRLLAETRIVGWRAKADRSRFLYVAPTARMLLGYPLDAWYEEGFWRSRVDPADVDQMAAPVAGISHAVREYAYRMRAADGRAIWVNEIGTVHRDPRGATTLEGFLFEIRSMARHAPALDRLTAAAHDIAQPLAAILANAQAASRLHAQHALPANELHEILTGIIADAQRAAADLVRIAAAVHDVEQPGDRNRP
jgi:hypothetical protein